MLRSFARVEHLLRPALTFLPPHMAVRIFSAGRTWFAHRLGADVRRMPLPEVTPVRAWGLDFRIPLWNAAGMFKNGEGYYAMASHGAGGWVAGTTTSLPRSGNLRDGIRWPAASYPRSGSASNWMGLPNKGHAAVAASIARLERRPLCPIGVSVSADPGMAEHEALPGLVNGMDLYERAGVDFIELNESCPNVPGHGGHAAPALDESLIRRLEYVQQHILRKRKRALPVLVKFSVDTAPEQIPGLVGMLVSLGFDGVILGNTSTRYAQHLPGIDPADRALYEYFTGTFGGGLSGRVVKEQSLNVSTQAARYLRSFPPQHEFHVVRCGGVEGRADLEASRTEGIVLHQWYTGYFDRMSYADMHI